MKKLQAITIAALLIAGVAAFTGPRTEGSGLVRPAVTRQEAPFYWAGFYNWDGAWCSGLFNDAGQLLWYWCG